MSRRAIIRYRWAAFAFWCVAVAWTVVMPDEASLHRILIGAAITATITAVIGAGLLDLRAATHLATEAGRRQALLEHAKADL